MVAGKMYVLVRTAANPNGELRAQLLPSGFGIKLATLTGAAEVPAVVSGGSGLAVATVDSTGMPAAVHVHLSGISATGAEVDTGAAGVVGTQLAVLVVDALDPNHYLNEAVALTGPTSPTTPTACGTRTCPLRRTPAVNCAARSSPRPDRSVVSAQAST